MVRGLRVKLQYLVKMVTDRELSEGMKSASSQTLGIQRQNLSVIRPQFVNQVNHEWNTRQIRPERRTMFKVHKYSMVYKGQAIRDTFPI